jgi:iron transport multicopper oxidase
MGQYPDGLWGPLIVHDPNPPFHFDEEITLTLSDWYHEQMPDLIYAYQSAAGEAANGTPIPSGGALMNSGKDVKIYVKPGKTYLVHVICPANYPGHAWFFDQHQMTTVEVDGVYVDPVNVNAGLNGTMKTRVGPGQRMGVLINTKNDTSTNYAILDIMDVNQLFINNGIVPPPSDYNTNVTGYLIYNDSAPLPPTPVLYSLDDSEFFDDLDYVPLDHEPLLEPVDHQIILNTNSANISGISRYVFLLCVPHILTFAA